MDIRPATVDDLNGINDLYNHYVRTSECTFDLDPITMDQRTEWFETFTGRYKLLVSTDADTVTGYAGTKAFRPKAAYAPSVESSVYVHHRYLGQGIGNALYGALFDAIRHEDIHRIYAGITWPNPASKALHERYGFHQVAHFTEQGRKFDRYWDVVWFEKAM